MENRLSKYLAEQYTAMADWVNGNIDPLTDEELAWEIAPGKNHGIWILGHLIVSDDDFSVYMGKDDFLFKDYIKLFGQGSKLQTVENYPEPSLLRKQWKEVIEKNKKVYTELTDEELSQPHARIKNIEDDYFKTKENIAKFWQLHQMYHAGQLGILVTKAGKANF